MVKKIFPRKLVIGLCVLLIILGGFGYFGYRTLFKKVAQVRYVLATAQEGDLTISVSGNGNILASDQVEIKSKVSGEVLHIGVKVGQEVKSGTLFVKIDPHESEKAVRDIERDLEIAKLELEKLLKPLDELTLFQAENALVQAQELKQKAEDNLQKAYEDALNTITNIFFDLPVIITTTRNILYSYEIGESEKDVSPHQHNLRIYRNSLDVADRYKIEPFIQSAEDNYLKTKEKYDKNLENYKKVSRYSEKEIIEALLNETIETIRATTETIKSQVHLLDFVADYLSKRNRPVYSKIIEYQTNLKTYTEKINNYLSTLLSFRRSLQDSKEALINAERTIKEKKLSLAKLKAGPTELQIRTKKIAIQKKEEALLTAKRNLADCYIYIPFDGIVTEIKAKRGETVSSGAVLGTIISRQKIAEISLNEIEIAKVKIGQKATLTLDALPDLKIAGEIIEIAPTTGVIRYEETAPYGGPVTYKVKIAFNIEDKRIKPGMSVTADIIIETKENVLILPNSAIKSERDVRYVELVEFPPEIPEEIKQQLLKDPVGAILPLPPKRKEIEVGVSDDLNTEIISGLKKGDIVVVSTIEPIQIPETPFPGMAPPAITPPGMTPSGMGY